MTPPVLRIGWQTDQAANSKDLSFRVNPAFYQSNPRLGKNPTALPAAPATPLPRLGDVYNLPFEVPATPPAVKIEGSKYCVKTSDWGVTNGLSSTDTQPHICSAGNVAVGAATAAGL
jgi:hypothetical protein